MLKQLLCFVIGFSLIMRPAFAGEAMPAGTTLQQDSYVFTLEEANDLRKKIEELELKEEKLEEYIILDEIHQDQIVIYQRNVDISQQQAAEYKNITDIQASALKRYENKDKWNRVENAAILTGGIVITIASFLVVDKINDHMMYNNVEAATNAGLTVSF